MARETATNRYPVLPVCRVTSIALFFVIKHWSTGLYRDVILGFLALSTPCRQRTNKSQRQRQTRGRTGSSIQDQMLRLPGHSHWWNRQKRTLVRDWLNTNERREMMTSTISLPNTIYRPNIKLTGTLRHVLRVLLSTTRFRKLVY